MHSFMYMDMMHAEKYLEDHADERALRWGVGCRGKRDFHFFLSSPLGAFKRSQLACATHFLRRYLENSYAF